MSGTLVLDSGVGRQLIRERKEKGIDGHDEVWEGVYVMSPLASLEHQDLAIDFANILSEVVKKPGLGRVHAGANVSDRRTNWKKNYRVPDIVVVLTGGRAVDCDTHWFGGPDFLMEIESPDDDIEKKIPFYSKIGVRELLIIDRDTRALRLFRLAEGTLVLVGQSESGKAIWLQSLVLPLAFRYRANHSKPHVEVKRSDGKTGNWVV
jgi:Uma2 family endonuclease